MYQKIIFPRALEYFLAIVEYGSFSRAAEALHVSQPSLSQQIKQLEGLLQTRLLIRPGRIVRLTDAGEIFHGFAKRARAEMVAGARAVNDVQDLSRGTLRVGWTPITDHLTYDLIDNFHHQHPGIILSTFEMSQEYLEQSVTEDTIDIGIAFTQPDANSVRAQEFETRIMFNESLFLAVGDKHPLAKFTQGKTPQTDSPLSMVLLNRDFALRQHIDEYCKKHSLTPQIAIETNSVSVILELVESGRLATILPKTIIDNRSNLHSIKLEVNLPQHAVSLIWRRHGYINPACAAFIELATNWHPQKHKGKTTSPRKSADSKISVLPASFLRWSRQPQSAPQYLNPLIRN